jgi:hypothetical protein
MAARKVATQSTVITPVRLSSSANRNHFRKTSFVTVFEDGISFILSEQ